MWLHQICLAYPRLPSGCRVSWVTVGPRYPLPFCGPQTQSFAVQPREQPGLPHGPEGTKCHRSKHERITQATRYYCAEIVRINGSQKHAGSVFLFPTPHPSLDHARLTFAWLVFTPSLLYESLAQGRI